MKNKLKKFTAWMAGIVGFAFFIPNIGANNAFANEKYDTYQIDAQIQKTDIKDGTSTCYNEDGGIALYQLDAVDKCDNFCFSHGLRRIFGGTALLDNGCRNYITNNYNYGTTDIPYWINMSSINKISNEAHRTQILNDIRTEVAMWNEVKMYDGTGQIVKLYEVNQGTTTKPAKINGRNVIEVVQDDLTSKNNLGEFSHAGKVTLNYSGGEIGYETGTILHEFGHVLGLGDIDKQDGVHRGDHGTLMGYGILPALDFAITYPDIQGVAVMTGKHVCKDSHFMRYVKRGDQYLHICFYCDRIDSRTTPISGSQPVANNGICAHQYEPMVSSGSQSWLKCVKCYSVVEEDAIVDFMLFSGGSGTKDDPFLIKNEEEFRHIGMAYTKSGSVNILSYSYKLMVDIDLTGENWIPFVNKFTGEFDGNGHSVTYHTIVTQAVLDMPKVAGKIGLFGYIGPGAVIKNLELWHCSIRTEGSVSYSGQIKIGILAGYIEAVADLSSVKVNNSTISVAQCKQVSIGGIAGVASRTNMNNCELTGGNIYCYNETVGGFAGQGDIGGINGGRCEMMLIVPQNIYDKLITRTGKLLGNNSNSNSNVFMNVKYLLMT